MNTAEDNNSIRKTVRAWRDILNGKKQFVNEDVQSSQQEEAVPYDKNEQVVTDITSAATSEFGAKFDKYDNPVVYIPSTEDVRVNGDIPSIGKDTKFEFHYRPEHAGEECIIYTDMMFLNEDVLSKLNKMYGVFKNWKERTLDQMNDIKPMKLLNQSGNSQPQQQQQPQQNAPVRGDDLD